MADDAGAIRDGRLPPFCYQTHSALAVLRAKFAGERRSTALAVYLSLTEAANLSGGAEAREGFEETRKALAEGAGVSPDTLDRYVRDLGGIGLVKVERRRLGKMQLPNLWTLLEPVGTGPGAPPPLSGAATPAAPMRPNARASTEEVLEEVHLGEDGAPAPDPEAKVVVRSVVVAAWMRFAPPLIAHRETFFDDPKVKRKIAAAVKKYPPADIAKAIENYATVLGPGYRWTHKWTFADFLVRGLDRFVDEAQPLENWRDRSVPRPGEFEDVPELG